MNGDNSAIGQVVHRDTPSRFSKEEHKLPTIARSVSVDYLLDEVRNTINSAIQTASLQAINVRGLSGFRQAAGVSQAELAKALRVTQSSVSSLEHSDDLLISTLTRYVSALGADCDIVVTLKNNTRLALKLDQLAH
jgi:DNA-binding XRE family transcriptional regulator